MTITVTCIAVINVKSSLESLNKNFQTWLCVWTNVSETNLFFVEEQGVYVPLIYVRLNYPTIQIWINFRNTSEFDALTNSTPRKSWGITQRWVFPDRPDSLARGGGFTSPSHPPIAMFTYVYLCVCICVVYKSVACGVFGRFWGPVAVPRPRQCGFCCGSMWGRFWPPAPLVA